MKPEELAAGAVIDGRFACGEPLAQGGMGNVVAARDLETGAQVALKLVPCPGSLEVHRALREARLLAALRHRHIVRHVADGEVAPGLRYLAMELLEGETLQARLRGAALSVEQTLVVAAQVADALAFAHGHGVIHRDIKPSNLFLVRDSDEIRVLDFGIARPGDQAITSTGTFVGTPSYAAPERLRETVGDLTPACDVFALGCVLHECLTRHRVFGGDDPVAVYAKILMYEPLPPGRYRPDVPRWLDEIILRMLHKDPRRRIGDGAAVACALAARGVGVTDGPAGSSLGGTERPLVSVVLTGPAGRPAADGTQTSAASTIVDRRPAAAVARSVGPLRAHLQWLIDGTVVAVVEGDDDDAALRAAYTALAIRSSIAGVPIVVATGRAEPDRASPLSEVIERAAQLLHDHGAAGHIYLDALTAGLLDTRFRLGGDGETITLEGEARPLSTIRRLLPGATPFVGRTRELADLERILDECGERSVARAVLVTGAAGIGKSRLCGELVARARSRRELGTWVARGSSLGAGSPFALLAQGTRRFLNLHDDEPAEPARARMMASVARQFAGDDLIRIGAFLGELLGVVSSDDHMFLRAARADPRVMGEQIRRAWCDWLTAHGRDRPLIAILEDLHWGDLASVKTIDAALRAARELPLLVIALARPEVEQTFPQLWATHGLVHLRLDRLLPRDSERLVRAIAPRSLRDDSIERLARLGDGNPFFLEELVRGGEAAPEASPSTVLTLVQARVSDLPPQARQVLRAASVFGSSFWRGGVEAVLGGEVGGDLDDVFESLVDRDFILRNPTDRYRDEIEYAFRHDLTRDAVYATVTERDRQVGHRLAAEWLAAHGELDAAALADHFERAGRHDRAAGLWLRAGQRALERDDPASASAYVARGLAVATTSPLIGELLQARAEIAAWVNDLPASVTNATAAATRLPAGSEGWWLSVIYAVDPLAHLGERAAVVAWADRVLAVGGRLVDAVAVRALCVCFDSLRMVGEHVVAERCRARALATPAEVRAADPYVAARLRVLEAKHLGEELAGYEAVRAYFRSTGNHRAEFYFAYHVARVELELGSYDDAMAELREVAAMGTRTGFANVDDHARATLAECLAARDQLADATAALRDAIDGFGRRRHGRCETVAAVELAYVLALRGDLAAADQALAGVHHAGPRTHDVRGLALAVAAFVALRRCDPVAAGLARQALDAPGRLPPKFEELARLVLAEALWAAGERARARDAIGVARDQILARVAGLSPERTATFLHAVPLHRDTLRLWEAWCRAEPR